MFTGKASLQALLMQPASASTKYAANMEMKVTIEVEHDREGWSITELTGDGQAELARGLTSEALRSALQTWVDGVIADEAQSRVRDPASHSLRP